MYQNIDGVFAEKQTERLQTDTVLDTGTTTCRDHSRYRRTVL